jgi:hypothetical protein
MAIFRNESKGIAVLLRTNMESVSLKPGEALNIDEKLVLRFPKNAIKKYSDKEWVKLTQKITKEKQKSLNTKKDNIEQDNEKKDQQSKQEIEEEKSLNTKKDNTEQNNEKKVQQPKKTRGRKSKKGEENAKN